MQYIICLIKVITIVQSICVLVLSTLCCLGEGIVDVDEVVAEVGYVGADQLPLCIVLQNTAMRILGELSDKILLIARIGRGEHQKV